jgi:branched-chain amino acid transport system ATP-binding protein
VTTGLDVVHVRAGYGAVEVLHDLTLRFPLGSVVALLGRNGAGKSSLLRVVAGTLDVDSGHVTWHGRDITRLSPNQRAAAGITVVPDDPNVFYDLSVADNLALFGNGASPDPVYAAFPELAGKARQRANTLSGGERQMLALGGLLLRPGDALLLDEASRGLSAGAVERLYRVLGDLATPERTIVVVEQYHPDILRRADLIYVLSRGELAWAGESSELSMGPLPRGIGVSDRHGV